MAGAKTGGAKILDFSFSWVKIRLHTEFQLPIMPVSGPTVCGGGGGGGGGGGCVSQFQC